MNNRRYDFAGWVTKNDILCTDGVVIKQNAFATNDNHEVPLVWNHVHNDPKNVLGHIRLQNRKEGVYGYGYFNDTDEANHAKELVEAGDIVSMSIAANKIQKQGRDVVHGNIYEVSLVLAGANEGAKIEHVITHSGEEGDSIIVETYEIIHSANYPDEEDEFEEFKMENEFSELIKDFDDEDYEVISDYITELTGSTDVPLNEVLDAMNDTEAKQTYDFIVAYANNLKGDGDTMYLNHSDEEFEEDYEDFDEEDYEDFDEEDDSIDYLDDDDIEDVVELVGELTGYAFDNIEDAIDALDEEDTEIVNEFINDILEHKAEVELMHSDEEMIDDAIDELDDDDIEAVYDFISYLSDEEVNEDNVEEILDSLGESANEEVLDFVSYCNDNKEVEHSMYNVFGNNDQDLMHAAAYNEDLKAAIIDELKVRGSLRTAMLEHGITNIEQLVTAEPLTGAPGFIRPEEPGEVDKILASVKKLPKRSVKGRWADLTTEDARAKGYIKGNQKAEEFFEVWNRETHPQTIYKLQAMHEDDLEDTYDFDMVAMIKAEMKDMWRYELARDIFFPDGRLVTATDKVKEISVRPITADVAAFNTMVYGVTPGTFIETVQHKKAADYRGTGAPSLYADESFIINVCNLKDDNGRYVFGTPLSKEQLAGLLGVKEIVCPRFFQGTGMATLVNLTDYHLATRNEGKQYDDFDIQYNLHRYLFEGRVAGALNQPKAAITFTTAASPEALDDNA